MKVGRGHVCNKNPNFIRADQTLVDHLAMSLSGAVRCTTRSNRHFGNHILFYFIFILPTYSNTEHSLQAVLARVSALLAAQKEPKPTPERKIRGNKKSKPVTTPTPKPAKTVKRTAAAAAAEDDDDDVPDLV